MSLLRTSGRKPDPDPPAWALDRQVGTSRPTPASSDPRRHSKDIGSGLLASCSNPACRSGWLRLWRSREAPIFEEGWTCSLECTMARLRSAVAREFDAPRDSRERHPHRIPLGLLMMEQGWISGEQLRRGLGAQKAAGTGRLGVWLIRQKATSEEMVARALGLQWSCPVVGMDVYESSGLAAAIPRLLLDALGALPIRVAAGRVLYLGFEERLDPVLALAVERMTGIRVECCIVRESQFQLAHARILEERFPSAELVEAISQTAAAAALARAVERFRPAASRLVRVHDCLWLRMWLGPQQTNLPRVDTIHDVLCSIGPVGGTSVAIS